MQPRRNARRDTTRPCQTEAQEGRGGDRAHPAARRVDQSIPPPVVAREIRRGISRQPTKTRASERTFSARAWPCTCTPCRVIASARSRRVRVCRGSPTARGWSSRVTRGSRGTSQPRKGVGPREVSQKCEMAFLSRRERLMSRVFAARERPFVSHRRASRARGFVLCASE